MPRPRVLIVEDTADIAHALSKLFWSLGWEPSVSETASDAVVMLEANFQLIILDLMLPDRDGSEILRVVREKGLKIPVVISTANPDAAARVKPLDPDAMFEKPIDYPAFAEFVTKVKDSYFKAKG